jgi:hypothetical protein
MVSTCCIASATSTLGPFGLQKLSNLSVLVPESLQRHICAAMLPCRCVGRREPSHVGLAGQWHTAARSARIRWVYTHAEDLYTLSLGWIDMRLSTHYIYTSIHLISTCMALCCTCHCFIPSPAPCQDGPDTREVPGWHKCDALSRVPPCGESIHLCLFLLSCRTGRLTRRPARKSRQQQQPTAPQSS